MAPYERFVAWQLCHQLALMVYRVSKNWPKEERYGITAQARRAAFSAAANIVEGAARRGPGEFRRFLDISGSSLAELGYWVRVARDLEFSEQADRKALERLHRDASRTTWGLYDAVSANTSPSNRLSA
jgi:four helix bundle protein